MEVKIMYASVTTRCVEHFMEAIDWSTVHPAKDQAVIFDHVLSGPSFPFQVILPFQQRVPSPGHEVFGSFMAVLGTKKPNKPNALVIEVDV